jgi:hypothetical protein
LLMIQAPSEQKGWCLESEPINRSCLVIKQKAVLWISRTVWKTLWTKLVHTPVETSTEHIGKHELVPELLTPLTILTVQYFSLVGSEEKGTSDLDCLRNIWKTNREFSDRNICSNNLTLRRRVLEKKIVAQFVNPSPLSTFSRNPFYLNTQLDVTLKSFDVVYTLITQRSFLRSS